MPRPPTAGRLNNVLLFNCLNCTHDIHFGYGTQRNCGGKKTGEDGNQGGLQYRKERKRGKLPGSDGCCIYKRGAQPAGYCSDSGGNQAIVSPFPEKGLIQAPDAHPNCPLYPDFLCAGMDVRIYGIYDVQQTDQADE